MAAAPGDAFDRSAHPRYPLTMAGNDHLRKHDFKKGVSGNPGGRPKAAMEMARLIAKETRNGAELVEFALRVLRGVKAPSGDPPTPDDPKSIAYAHTWLTERVAGKAPVAVDMTVVTGAAAIDLSALSPAALDAIVQAGELNPPEVDDDDVGRSGD